METGPNQNLRNSLSGSDQEDTYLIAKISDGDEDAYDRLVAKYEHRMLKTALKFIHNPEDAKDVVVDASLRILQAAGSFKLESRFASWLTRIVINCALDAVRRDPHKHTISLEDAFGKYGETDPPLIDPDWENEFDFADPEPVKRERIHDLLPTMTEENQRLLRMNYLDQLPYKAIAKELAIPVGTVKSRLSRARLELRQRCESRIYAA